MFDYIHDPAEIYEKSFTAVRAEADLSGFAPEEAEIAVRLIHACGMPDIAPDLVFGGDGAGAGRQALSGGASVLADAEMVAVSRLLKSWATPPASIPTASIFRDWRSCSSKRARSSILASSSSLSMFSPEAIASTPSA